MLEKKVKGAHEIIEMFKDFLIRIAFTDKMMLTTEKLGIMKLNNFCTTKETNV